ncbi:uncharacterized protein LOC126563094 [Anopheles maculipalpis]|uniref:uncharacterized protein LOC126563094 n=1 Tax=Anopheles maculipalpis TaxID=1496333 RepID=UPI0021592DA7|nr:uncharacterized protein LOC126563094 [Anopheles maculipalpis]
MPKSPRKKQRTTQRSSRNRVAEQQMKLEETGVEQKGYKLTLFGKCIDVDEQDQHASYYAKLRFWFHHAIPQRSEDSPVPRMRYSSTTSCASPSDARQSYQHFDVPDETGIFQKMPPPLPANMLPYPTVKPFQRIVTQDKDFTSDPRNLLEEHVAHWKKVRSNWILYRRIYLQRYKPSFDFINSTYVQPVNE